MTDEIKIEKGIPIPPSKVPGRWAFLQQMEIGDSVFVPNVTTTTWRQCARLSIGSFKFTSRKEGEGTRIWRIA